MKLKKILNLKIILSLFIIICSINTIALAQNTKLPVKPTPNVNKNIPNKVFDPQNPISIAKSESVIDRVTILINEKRYEEAKRLIIPTVEWLKKSSEHHVSLYSILKNIDKATAQADIEKELALKSAVLRDKAMYQLAILYIEQKNIKPAIENLVNIVKSQPKTTCGFKAYEKLQELGFTYKAQIKQD